MSKLKVMMVGCGRISAVYKQSFKELQDQVQVLYAADLDVDKARTFANGFEGCTALTDYREGLEEVDVVHLATPHYLHGKMTMAALKKGIHVLVEKPVAISLADVDDMIEMAKRNNAKLGVVFQTRYVKGCLEIKKLIDEGRLGKLICARSYLAWRRGKEYYEGSDWKGTWDREGGGVLIDQAIHSIDRVRFLVGSDIKSIEGSIANRSHGYIKVEDTAEAYITFQNGCSYCLYATNSFGIDSPIEIEIVGEKGRAGLKQDLAWVSLDNEEAYEIRDGYDGLSVGKDYWGCSHITQMKDFYQSVLKDTPVFVDGMEGKKTLQVIMGIYNSANKGKKILLNDIS